MASTRESAERGDTGGDVEDQLLAVADWAVPVLLGIFGLALVFAGTALVVASDFETIADLVAEGVIESDVFADDDLAAVTYETARWSGIGLAATGVLGWIGAATFVWYRRRDRRREAETGRRSPPTAVYAIVGAVATVVTSFVPFSPIIGGFVAGYLHREEPSGATRAGALSGFFLTLPMTVLFLFVAGGAALGAARVGAAGGALLVGGTVVLSLLFTAAFTIGLGALGGYLAIVVHEEESEASRDRAEASDVGSE